MYCRYCGKILTTADNLDRCYPSCHESLERKTGLMITLQPYDYVALIKERDALRAENEKLKEVLREIAEDSNYREDSDNEVGWHIDNAYEVMNELKEKAQQALNEVE